MSAQYERSVAKAVSGIESVETSSRAGHSVIKVIFGPTVNIRTAISQVLAVEQSKPRQMFR